MTGIHPTVLMKAHSFRLYKFLSCQSLPSPQASYFSPGKRRVGSGSKGIWGASKKNLTQKRKEEKSKLEDPGEEGLHPLGTGGKQAPLTSC